jgi:hypothetical protein
MPDPRNLSPDQREILDAYELGVEAGELFEPTILAAELAQVTVAVQEQVRHRLPDQVALRGCRRWPFEQVVEPAAGQANPAFALPPVGEQRQARG